MVQSPLLILQNREIYEVISTYRTFIFTDDSIILDSSSDSKGRQRESCLLYTSANGRDPFQITKFDQTHHSLEVKKLYEAHEAELLKDRKELDVTGRCV